MEGPIPYGVAMRGKISRVVVLLLVVAGCSTTGTPATVPPSLPATTTTVAATTTTLPPTTTTTAATTTTIDRVTEIEAIFQNLEERRLQALYEGDEEAFKTLFANKEYMQRSLALFDLVEFADDWEVPGLAVVAVLTDSEGCIAVRIEWDYSGTLIGAEPAEAEEVVEFTDGRWGISYSGEGWACEGPHPLSP
jgi:ABC-type transport system substrate-binding protein